jgi:hypothetical protein
VLAAGADVHAATPTGATPLLAAVARGGGATSRADVVAALLAAGARADAPGSLLSASPMPSALAQRDTAVAALLRAAGAKD